jgi:hypothetical protein
MEAPEKNEARGERQGAKRGLRYEYSKRATLMTTVMMMLMMTMTTTKRMII